MPAYLTKSAPITAIIGRDYPLYPDHDMDEIVKFLHDSPPTLLTTGDDLTYNPHGSTWRRQPNGEAWVSPEEAKALDEKMRRWNKLAHGAGVRYILPYVCSGHIFGDPRRRTGMWMFYDRWDAHAHALGPKPPADPIEWIQREPNGLPHFNYPHRFIAASPERDWMPYEFAGCVNNPYWSAWLSRAVELAAQGGYDGVFVDNNIHHCYCRHCDEAFQDYLAETYTPAQRRARFGTDDLSGLHLSPLGDKVLWATAQREYLERIRRNEPADFRRVFGTDEVDAAVPSEAGNGFHWGRAHDFWLRKLAERHDPAQVERILREGDVSSLGIRTARELCLWADTQKFWAWSIGRAQARLRQAGEKARPGFLIMPNWGDMAGFRNVDSRRLEAKNVRLWKGGADIIFFEQEYFPCTFAPGYTFDHIISYKYSSACGIRSTSLPYHGAQYRALTELAFAEAAAWSGDGMYMQVRYRFPEVREHYRAFYDQRGDWFAGRESYAHVGLVLSFDEVHMENTHHLREAYALAHYLVDHHLLFDFLCEGQVTLSELRRFKVVIVPHVRYLPRSGRKALLRYLDEGGSLLLTGNTGAFDEHARAVRGGDLLANLRTSIWSQSGQSHVEFHSRGHVVWVNDVFSWLPKRAWQVHDLADFNVGPFYDKGIFDQVVAASKTESDDLRVAHLLDRVAGVPLGVLSGKAPCTLRVSAWASTRGKPSLVLHLINYDVPGTKLAGQIHETSPEQVEHVPVEDVEVTLPMPVGMKVSDVILADPWHPEGESLPFRLRAGRVRFTLPRVDIYRAVWVG